MSPPKILLMYIDNYTKHIADVIKFYQFLRMSHVIPMLDLFEIPRSTSQNPLVWYKEVFDEADYILIFAPPLVSDPSDLHPMTNCYSSLRSIAFNHLYQYLFAKNKISLIRSIFKFNCDKKLFSVRLPGCDWRKLFAEVKVAKDFKRVSLPDDIDKFLKSVKVPVYRSQLENLIYAFNAETVIDGDEINNSLQTISSGEINSSNAYHEVYNRDYVNEANYLSIYN